MYLQSPERSARVGSEKRIASASRNDCHASVLKKCHDGVPVVIPCYRFHRSGGKHLCPNTLGTQGHCKSQAVYYSRKHSHLVSVNTVESPPCTLKPTENIPPAYHYRHLFPFTDD